MSRRELVRAAGLAGGSVVLQQPYARAVARWSSPIGRAVAARQQRLPAHSARLLVADAIELDPTLQLDPGFFGDFPRRTPFGRVRALDDETRLNLDVLVAVASGATTHDVIDGSLKPQPAVYGIDESGPGRPLPSALGQLQQLFEDTPLDFVGIYLAPAPNHHNTDWMRVARDVRDQGWALIPFYVGRQQKRGKGAKVDDPLTRGHDHIDPAKAAAQGTDDGRDAARLAANADLPRGSTLWLDMENGQDFSDATFRYIDAWLDRVARSHYTAGVYLFAHLASQLRAHRPGTRMWITRSWYITPERPLLDDNLDVGGYCWSKPVGKDARREPVEMRKPADVPPHSRFDHNWEFVDFPEALGWQYRIDLGMVPADIHQLPRWLDTGVRADFPFLSRDIDLDLAREADPSWTAGRRPKTQRRRRVAKIVPSAQSIKSGAHLTVTVHLDRPVAGSADLIVLLRTDAPELILPTSAVVPKGQREVSVVATSVPVTSEVAARIKARTRHQLSGPFPSALVKITP